MCGVAALSSPESDRWSVPDLTVRQGRPDDDVALVTVKGDAIEAGADDRYTAAEVAAWSPDVETIAGYGQALESDRYLVLVAELDGEVVGYGVVNVEGGTLPALYVDPDHRDAGIGSTLLGHIETSAAFSGVATLELLASQNAVGFYESLGYERGEEIERVVHDESLTFVAMAKSLF